MKPVSWNRQLVLAAALFGLGTLAYWLEFKHKPEKEANEEQSKRIFLLKDNSVQSVRLQTPHQSFDFTCSDFSENKCKPGDNSKWEVVEPRKLKADDSNVNSLLSTLNNLSSNDTIDLKEETPPKKASLLKEYGLDPASLKTGKNVSVNTAAGTTTLYLGAQHPIGDHYYALMEKTPSGQKPQQDPKTDQVYLIPSFINVNLDHDLTYWRNKKLLGFSSHEIESFELNSPKAQFSAVRKEGQWTLTSGKDQFPGDRDSIDSLLSAAGFLLAKNFAAENKKDPKAKAFLKGGPLLTLTLHKNKTDPKEKESPPIQLSFYQTGPSGKGEKASVPLYATVSTHDPVYEIDPGARNRLEKTAKDLRQTKLITSMERFSAKRLDFSGSPLGNAPLTLVQKDGKWVESSHPTEEVMTDRIQALLDKLSGSNIKDFVKAAPAGEADGIKVGLSDDPAASSPKREFLFWRKDGNLYGKDLKSPTKEIYLMDPSVHNALPWDRKHFEKSEPPSGSGQGQPASSAANPNSAKK